MSLIATFAGRYFFLLLCFFCCLSFRLPNRYLPRISSFSEAGMISDGNKQDNQLTLVERITSALNIHKLGQFDDAIIAYTSVLPELTGKLASTLHSNVGSIYMNKGEYDLAKDHFTLAVEADAENAQSHFNLAVILTTKFNAHGKAIGHCGKALKLDPNMYKGLHLMGNIMQNLGKDIEAEKYFALAENLAQQLQSEQSTPDESMKDNGRSVADKNKDRWSNFEIMSAKIDDEFLIEKSLKLVCLSETPLIFKVSSFVSEDECEQIMGRASSQLEKSFVMGGQKATSDDSTGDENSDKSDEEKNIANDQLYRSSYNAWLHSDDLAVSLQRRLASVTGFPLQLFQQKSEELQVVKYEHGGQFKVHHDSSAFHSRLLTALIYLNDVPESLGGETWFPFAGERREFNLSIEEAISTALNMYPNTSPSRNITEIPEPKIGLYVRPVQGEAIIFFNHLSSGAIDPAAVHAGLPMASTLSKTAELELSENGETKTFDKWIANYWVEQDFKFMFGE
jgi:prolyl 4-hydroxylase